MDHGWLDGCLDGWMEKINYIKMCSILATISHIYFIYVLASS